MSTPFQSFPLIAVEGIDGVGKTTFVQALAARLGAVVYKSPGGPFAIARELLDKELDALTRYHFFRSAVQYDSEQLARLIRVGPVVCDRYIDSTIVCHAARDARIATIGDRRHLTRPTLTIVLTAHPSVVKRRLSARASLGHDERDFEFLLRCDAIFRGLGHPVLDTSERSPEQLVDAALGILNLHNFDSVPLTELALESA